MNARASHEQAGAVIRLGRFGVTPVSLVTVDALSLGGMVLAYGSKRVTAVLVTDGERTWRVEVPGPDIREPDLAAGSEQLATATA